MALTRRSGSRVRGLNDGGVGGQGVSAAANTARRASARSGNATAEYAARHGVRIDGTEAGWA